MKLSVKKMNDSIKNSGISRLLFSTLRITSVTVVFTYSYLNLPNLGQPETVATALIAVPGMLIGFLLTAVSLLVSSADNPFIINLRKTGHFSTLVENLSNSAVSWVIVLCMGFACHLLANYGVLLAFSVAMMFYSLIYFALSMFRFKQVIMSVSEP